jgi:glycerol-3-phosphate acyltransferase PlsY
VPFGVIAGRVIGGVDVRQYGSGSAGTTNVLRTVGRRAAAIVMILDMTKSVVAVLLARLLSDSNGVEVATALAAITGHIWPVFAGFRGGKGISVGWSALIVLSPISGLVAGLVGIPIIAASRYVSLGSIVGAVSGCVALLVLAITTDTPTVYVWYAAIGGSAVLVLHRENISRLIRGEERKLGQRVVSGVASPEPHRQKGFRWPGSA